VICFKSDIIFNSKTVPEKVVTTRTEDGHKWINKANTTIQGVPGGKDNILGGHSIGHSKQKTLYEHVSYSERFPR
jgi:hypothetical protein